VANGTEKVRGLGPVLLSGRRLILTFRVSPRVDCLRVRRMGRVSCEISNRLSIRAKPEKLIVSAVTFNRRGPNGHAGLQT
jgi:hypothetical protein